MLSWISNGKKLRGTYALVRMDGPNVGDEKWLFIKKSDRETDARRNSVSREPESLITNRTLDEIEEDKE